MSIDRLTDKYIAVFNEWPPRPVNVLDEDIEEQLKIAIEKNRPIPFDFDWYPEFKKDETT